MTKRYGNYQSNQEKKLKLGEEIWDTDIDDDALNYCFEVASQVYDQNNANSSQINITLPTYDAFKCPNGLISSTQAITTSNKKLSLSELELEVNRLKQSNEEKDGEISVLRCKMKETSSANQVQQQKTITEWREKVLLSEKEIKCVKSQLEFKNLEIANLKQHLIEVRRVTVEAASSSTQQFIIPNPTVKVNSASATKDSVHLAYNEAILEPVYPLRNVSMNMFEMVEPEKHTIKTTSFKLSCNTIPYLQNQQINNELYCKHRCIYQNEKYHDLRLIYSDVVKLVNSTSNELNSEECVESLTKIIYFTLIQIHDLNNYLVNVCSCLRTEDIQQADRSYLLDSNIADDLRVTNLCKNNELGMLVGKLVDFLSQVIFCCKYIQEYICGVGKLRHFQNITGFVDQIPIQKELVNKNSYFLTVLLETVKNVGKCRKAPVMCGFLVSVTNFLISIGKIEISLLGDINKDLTHKLFKELVFARPGIEVIRKITFLLKVYSQSQQFLNFLFSKNARDPLESKLKGFLYYSEGSCTFCVLSLLFQDTLFRVDYLPIETCFNMVSFFYNTFKTAYEIHQDNMENICSCIPQLYKLQVECIFKTLESFVEDFNNQKRNYDQWQIFLRHEMIQTILNLINFNNYELTEKYILVYCQFKECEQILKQEQFDITQLNTSEDLVNIPENNFNIDF